MKIRSDFVTNSSSTSYLLEVNKTLTAAGLKDKYKNDKLATTMISVGEALCSEFIEHDSDVWRGSDSGSSIDNIIKTHDDLRQYIVDSFDYMQNGFDDVMKSEPRAKEEYDRILKAIGEGGIVLLVNISYHDQFAKSLLSMFVKSGLVGIIPE